MQELFYDDDDEDGDLIQKLDELGVKLPSRKAKKRSLRARISMSYRFIVGLFARAWGKIAWVLWGKRAFLRRIETQKQRWRDLAGVYPGMKVPDQKIESNYVAPPWHHGAAYYAPSSIAPPPIPRPPAVTDRVMVDYRVVVGRPYLVSEDGQRVDYEPPPPKPKRPRTTRRGGKKVSRGKPSR